MKIEFERYVYTKRHHYILKFSIVKYFLKKEVMGIISGGDKKVKKLPKPGYYVQIENVTVRNREEGEKLVEFLRKHNLSARVKLQIRMNCFGCKHRDERLQCIYGLHHNICPIGGLFNHRKSFYEKLKKELEVKGFDTSWLDQYYEER